MRDELICLFERPATAYAARRELRALQKELRLGRIASIAIVTRPALDNVQFEQDGDVGSGAGARFGLVAGALLGALLLAPFAGVRVAVAAREGLAAAPSAADWATALALVVALVSGLTALLTALGGALLGALTASLLNFGLPTRLLSVIGEGLEFDQVALVARVNERQRRPLADALVLAGGTLLQLSGAQGAPSPAVADLAARFTARVYGGAGAAQLRDVVVVALETPPVDPRQRDVVVAEYADAAHARRAARSLRRLRGSFGGLVAGNRAVVTRDEQGRVRIQQAENVTAGRGALFGFVIAGLAGVLVGSLFGVAVAALALMVSQGTATVPANAGGLLVTFALVFGGIAALVFGLGGGLLGAAVARIVNLAYKDADLRQIAETVPAGKALLIASVYHHGGPAAVSALRAEGATIRHMPLPVDRLAEATIDEQRRTVLSPGDETQHDTRRLIPTRSGVRIFVDWHHRGEQTIVLLHGAGGDHLAWQVQYPALHSAGFSTLALDLRGHGYSDRPRGADDYRLDRFAEDVYDVLEALKVREFIMVGHCFGGMVATMFHQAHPQRSKGYLLLDTAAHAPAAPRWVATQAPWIKGLTAL